VRFVVFPFCENVSYNVQPAILWMGFFWLWIFIKWNYVWL